MSLKKTCEIRNKNKILVKKLTIMYDVCKVLSMLDLKNKIDKIIIVAYIENYFLSNPDILDYKFLWFMCNKLYIDKT